MKIDQKSVQMLVKLGLSPDESACYIALTSHGSLSAVQLAKKLHVFPNAVYRIMKKLEEKGFVVALDSYPVTFQAVPPSVAIGGMVKEKEKTLTSLHIASVHALTHPETEFPQTKIDMVAGKHAMFDTYAGMANHAKEEILVISIGEPVPDEVKIANRDAQERGVKIKFLVHQYNKDNVELLRSWVQMGLEVRYIRDRGFHLMVFDRKRSLLAANNPEQTSERVSMIIHSEGISRALRDYFYSVWVKAAPINSS